MHGPPPLAKATRRLPVVPCHNGAHVLHGPPSCTPGLYPPRLSPNTHPVLEPSSLACPCLSMPAPLVGAALSTQLTHSPSPSLLSPARLPSYSTYSPSYTRRLQLSHCTPATTPHPHSLPCAVSAPACYLSPLTSHLSPPTTHHHHHPPHYPRRRQPSPALADAAPILSHTHTYTHPPIRLAASGPAVLLLRPSPLSATSLFYPVCPVCPACPCSVTWPSANSGCCTLHTRPSI